VPRTVAVTGATGFIGRHLVRQLADAGYRVRILVRRLPVGQPFADRTVEAVIGGLEDDDSLHALLSEADAVIHAAGLIKARSRDEFFAVNAAGARRVAEAAARQPAPVRFVLLSSLAAREPQLSDYAASKRAGETALTQSAGALSWTIVRPPVVYGPGDRETLAFFRAAERGFVPIPAGVEGRISMIHAEDLVAAVIAVMGSRNTVGCTLEVDDGRAGGYSWHELVATAGKVLGGKPRLVRIPRPMLVGFGLLNQLVGAATAKVPMLTPGKVREVCHPDWACRDRTIVERTDWRPRHSLRDGFAETVAWYRNQGWL